MLGHINERKCVSKLFGSWHSVFHMQTELIRFEDGLIVSPSSFHQPLVLLFITCMKTVALSIIQQSFPKKKRLFVGRCVRLANADSGNNAFNSS